MWFGEFLINHHGESTVFDDAVRLHRMVNDTLIANKYKYERLLGTIEFEYSLNNPIERKVTEVHSGSDTTTIDTDTATHRSGTDTTTDRYAQRDNRQYTTTEDSTTEYLHTHNQTDAVTDVNEAAYNSGQTGHTDGTNTLAHGHNIETIYSFHREPQTEIQAERLIAEFSLHMTIINDVLDAIALPVYLF